MKIAIIKTGALGDVVRTTCLLEPLHESFPGVDITWYTGRAAAPLLEGHPGIHRLFAVEDAPPPERFDWVLGLDEDEPACRLAAAHSARRRFGAYRALDGRLTYTPDSGPWFDMGLLNRDPDGSLTTANRLKNANRKTYPRLLFEMLGLDADRYAATARPSLPVHRRHEHWALDFIFRNGVAPGRPVIGLNSGTGKKWPTKQLSIERAAALLQTLDAEFHSPILLLGGPGERERHAALLTDAPATVIDGGANHSLPRFVSVVNRCDIVISSDSLAMHVAASLGKRVAAFFGPTPAHEIELYGSGFHWLPAHACACFFRPSCTRPGDFCLDSLDDAPLVERLRTWMNEMGFPSLEWRDETNAPVRSLIRGPRARLGGRRRR